MEAVEEGKEGIGGWRKGWWGWERGEERKYDWCCNLTRVILDGGVICLSEPDPGKKCHNMDDITEFYVGQTGLRGKFGG